MAKAMTLSCMALATCTAASAQTSVKIFGVVDTAVEYVTHFNGDTGSVFRMGSNNTYGSRFGLMGSEDLGGGLTAMFRLEQGFAPKNGSLVLGGRMWGRESSVGLRKGAHALLLGRLLNPLIDSVNRFDPTIYAQQSLASQDPGMVARGDSAIRYDFASAPYRATLFYSLGVDDLSKPIGGAAGGSSRAKDFAAAAGYYSSSLSLSMVYDNTHGPLSIAQHGVGYVVPSLLPVSSSSSDRAERFVLGASYKFGSTELRSGWRLLRTTGSGTERKSDIIWAGVVQSMHPYTFVAGTYHQKIRGFGESANSYVLAAYLHLSKRSLLYVNLSRVNNSRLTAVGTDTNIQTVPGGGQTGVQIGMTHFF